MVENAQKTVENGQGTFMGHSYKWSGHGSVVTLNGQERLGTFEPVRRNALERILENFDVHVSKAKELL